MNEWIDRGAFLLVLYTLIYVTSFGAPPEWIGLYSGAFAILAVGIGIAVYRKVKSR